MTRRIAMASLLLLGCASDPDSDEDDTGTASADGSDGLSDTGACEPGSPGCSCANDMCLDPLVCLDEVCIWPPPDDAGDAPSDDSGSDDGGTTSIGCVEDVDCGPDDICGEPGECVAPVFSAYEVTVTSWAPTSCVDGGLGGSADLWWNLTLANAEIGRSAYIQGGCPGAWEARVCVPFGAFVDPFRLNLFDAEVTTDTLIDSLWVDPFDTGMPDAVPQAWLLEGAYDGPSNAGGEVHVTFERLSGDCG